MEPQMEQETTEKQYHWTGEEIKESTRYGKLFVVDKISTRIMMGKEVRLYHCTRLRRKGDVLFRTTEKQIIRLFDAVSDVGKVLFIDHNKEVTSLSFKFTNN